MNVKGDEMLILIYILIKLFSFHAPNTVHGCVLLSPYSILQNFFYRPGEQRLVAFETLLLFTTIYCLW